MYRGLHELYIYIIINIIIYQMWMREFLLVFMHYSIISTNALSLVAVVAAIITIILIIFGIASKFTDTQVNFSYFRLFLTCYRHFTPTFA